MAINKAEVLRQSRHLSKEQMMEYIRCQMDPPHLTAAEFDKLMRDLLPHESAYQSAIIGYIKKNYPSAFVWKAAAGPYSRRGIPDICAIIDGQFYGFEVKRPYVGVLSKIQEQTLEAIRQAGGEAAVVSFPEQVEKIIDGEECEESFFGSLFAPPPSRIPSQPPQNQKGKDYMNGHKYPCDSCTRSCTGYQWKKCQVYRVWLHTVWSGLASVKERLKYKEHLADMQQSCALKEREVGDETQN